MRVAKYWRNNKLRYRLIKSAEGIGKQPDIKSKSKDKHSIELRSATVLEAEKA